MPMIASTVTAMLRSQMMREMYQGVCVTSTGMPHISLTVVTLMRLSKISTMQ